MHNRLENFIVSFLLGIFLGMLIGITIRYPLNPENIKAYQALCGDEPITQIKVGFSGAIYSVQCKNGAVVKVK